MVGCGALQAGTNTSLSAVPAGTGRGQLQDEAITQTVCF